MNIYKNMVFDVNKKTKVVNYKFAFAVNCY